MKKSIFIVTPRLQEVLDLGVYLNHLNKISHNKTIVEYIIYSPAAEYTIKWSLDLKSNSIVILRDIPGRVKALVNLNKSRYQPQKIIILK